MFPNNKTFFVSSGLDSNPEYDQEKYQVISEDIQSQGGTVVEERSTAHVVIIPDETEKQSTKEHRWSSAKKIFYFGWEMTMKKLVIF